MWCAAIINKIEGPENNRHLFYTYLVTPRFYPKRMRCGLFQSKVCSQCISMRLMESLNYCNQCAFAYLHATVIQSHHKVRNSQIVGDEMYCRLNGKVCASDDFPGQQTSIVRPHFACLNLISIRNI